MRKQNLFDLTQRVRAIVQELPVIVGSQAIFAVTDFPPDLVTRSVECDYLLMVHQSDLRVQLTKELGVFSDYQVESGYFADALGLATVVLPRGWEQRLVELTNDDHEIVAYCVEIHDVAVSKLLAGRDKDYEFLAALFVAEYLRIETFLDRLDLLIGTTVSSALADRIVKLIDAFEQEVSLRTYSFQLRNFTRKL